jgi:hypothetical protein
MSWEIDYLALLPEIGIVVTILVVLALDLFLPRPLKYWTATVAVLGVTLSAIPLILLWASDPRIPMFDGSYVVDDFAIVLKGLFLVAGYITLLMSVSYIESDRYYQGEYYVLLLTSILGSMVMASSRDLIVLFIGLELTTSPLFMLAGWRKGDLKSNEASLKYFILGVLSTAILLWGMSMLFGVTGAVQFDEISVAVDTIMAEQPDMQPLLGLAVMFILVGFGFKVSAVPFHFWAPDTYEGAPTPVTAYLSVSSKAAGFVGHVRRPLRRPPGGHHLLGSGTVGDGGPVHDRCQPGRSAPDQHRSTARLLVDRPGGFHAGPVRGRRRQRTREPGRRARSDRRVSGDLRPHEPRRLHGGDRGIETHRNRGAGRLGRSREA